MATPLSIRVWNPSTTAFDADAAKVAKGFTGPIIEQVLGSYPGFAPTRMPGPGTAYGVYTPAYIDRSAVEHTVVHHDGEVEVIPDPKVSDQPLDRTEGLRPSPYPAPADRLTRRLPLGTFVHGRSGDKGGDANLGVWARSDAGYEWLSGFLTVDELRRLLPECAPLAVDRYELPNLRALNFVIHGLLGEGVAASTRFDPQAKALGEWLRSRLVDVPEELA